MTVGEWRTKHPERHAWSACHHLQRRTYARGKCRNCYAATYKNRRDRETDPEYYEKALYQVLRWIEHSERRPPRFYVPMDLSDLPIGGYDLGWAVEAQRAEKGSLDAVAKYLASVAEDHPRREPPRRRKLSEFRMRYEDRIGQKPKENLDYY